MCARLPVRGAAGGLTSGFLERRRVAAAAAWDLRDGVVLVAAGDEIPVTRRDDRTYPFRTHSEYMYVADRERSDRVLASTRVRAGSSSSAPVADEDVDVVDVQAP